MQPYRDQCSLQATSSAELCPLLTLDSILDMKVLSFVQAPVPVVNDDDAVTDGDNTPDDTTLDGSSGDVIDPVEDDSVVDPGDSTPADPASTPDPVSGLRRLQGDPDNTVPASNPDDSGVTPDASVSDNIAADPVETVEPASVPEEIAVTIGTVKKYNYNVDTKDFSIVPGTADGARLASSGCTNAVLSYTLNVYFDVLSAENAAFKITKIEADVIYGDVSGTNLVVQRSASVNWVQEKTFTNANNEEVVSQFRLNSGGSGYDIDSAIKVGSVNNDDFIAELKHGLRLRGADNDGECQYVEASLNDELNFYEDPLLSFTDSTLYGCHLDLTLAELQEFCDSNKY
jgi:hypothetical protein